MKIKTLAFYCLLVILTSLTQSFSLDFAVKPIRIYIYPQKNTAVIELQSFSDDSIMVETEVKHWDQNKDGSFILKDTEDVIVVPPFIKLEPKQRQLVKIAYLGDFDRKLQGTYRLLLKQLPKEVDIKGESDKIKTAVQIVLHLSIPVFVNPPGVNLFYHLKFSQIEKSKKEVKVLIKNEGTAFARISKVYLYNKDKEIFYMEPALYILPKKEVILTVKHPQKGNKTSFFKEVPDKIKIVTEDEKEFIFNL